MHMIESTDTRGHVTRKTFKRVLDALAYGRTRCADPAVTKVILVHWDAKQPEHRLK